MKNAAQKLLKNVFSGTDSLTKRLTIEEAEVEFSIVLEGFGTVPIPFGMLHPEWQRFKRKMRPGDELWEFLAMFPRGDGLRGVKLLRDGTVIDSIGSHFIPAPQPTERKKPAPKKRADASRKDRPKGKPVQQKANQSSSAQEKPKKKLSAKRKTNR